MITFSHEDQLKFLAQLTKGQKDGQLLRMLLSLADSVKRSDELSHYHEQESLRKNSRL